MARDIGLRELREGKDPFLNAGISNAIRHTEAHYTSHLEFT